MNDGMVVDGDDNGVDCGFVAVGQVDDAGKAY